MKIYRKKESFLEPYFWENVSTLATIYIRFRKKCKLGQDLKWNLFISSIIGCKTFSDEKKFGKGVKYIETYTDNFLNNSFANPREVVKWELSISFWYNWRTEFYQLFWTRLQNGKLRFFWNWRGVFGKVRKLRENWKEEKSGISIFTDKGYQKTGINFMMRI